MSIQWPLAIFTLLAGTGAGTMVFAGLGEILNIGAKTRRLAGWISVILIVVGGIASVFHLGNPANFMSAVVNLGSFSGISVELIMLAIATVVMVIYALVAKEEGSGAGKAMGVIALVVGLIFAFVLGSSYQLGARPAWDNVFLTISYFGSGLSMGGFVYLTLLAIKKEDAADIKKNALFVLIVAAIGILAFLVYGVMVGEAAMVENGALFWVGVVVIGGIAPLVAGFAVWRDGKKNSFIYAGLVGAVVGGIALRALMWVLGNPAIHNLFEVASQNRGLYPF